MKMKTYTFTETEICALRNACEENWFIIKGHQVNSPLAKEIQQATYSLYQQFKQDYSTI